MKISMYALSHDVFRKALAQLLHVMEKGVANAKARNFDPNVFVSLRLAPDMLPFSKQVQLTSDFAKNSISRRSKSCARSLCRPRPNWNSAR